MTGHAPRTLGVVVATFALAACGGSSHRAGGPTTTTDATAYATAYSVCLQFYNTDAARNAEPQTLSDDAADEVFYGLALQLRPASRKDPAAWAKVQRTADTLRAQLGVKSTATDDQIEKAISDMGDACTKAKRRPASLPTTPAGPQSSSTTVVPTSTSGP